MTKLTATLLTFVLFIQTAPAVSAKPKGDWNAVKALANHSIAVKTTNGETHYGLLKVADDNAIQIQIAGHEDYTPREIGLRRDEVAKVWRAKLRFGERNVGKGALIGVGAGYGFVMLIGLIQRAQGSSDAIAGGALFLMAGAGAGAVAGKFWKKKHKKQELVYSI